jgi:serine/threonine protein kinase
MEVMQDGGKQGVATGMQLGPYVLRERLGLGGMASVWKAIDERGRAVVVKRILPALAEDPEFVSMFEREAALSARMRHPNIVRVFAHGDYEGERYLTMEHLHGKDLASVMHALTRNGPPPAGLGVFVAREVARALSYVHTLADDEGQALDLMHRDVSLSNVMLCYDGAVKLVDFGVAKALADERSTQTQAGVLKGKWAYLAPEQVTSGPVDQRADIFSLGIVMYEMLTGRRAFKAATGLETLQKVKAAQLLPPSAHNPALPPELDAICMKALARLPGDRYATAAEMVAALDEFVAKLSFQAPELALQMKRHFAEEARAFQRAQSATPAGEWPLVVEEDGETRPHPKLAAPLTLAALRAGRTRRQGQRARRIALAAVLAITAGGLVGWKAAGCRPKPAPPAKAASLVSASSRLAQK